MKNILFLFTVLSLLACGGRSGSDKILEEFKKVNASLDSSNKKLEGKYSFDLYYLDIKLLKDKNPVIYRQADSLYNAANAALAFLDNLKETLQLMDTTGENLSVATNLLVKGPAGDSLAAHMSKVVNATLAFPASDSLVPELTNSMLPLTFISKGQQWKKNYFEQTPTIAAITVLSKFENDVRNTGIIVLKDMARRIKE